MPRKPTTDRGCTADPASSEALIDGSPAMLLRMALTCPAEAGARFSGYRLTQLVATRFDMDDAEASAFARLTGHAQGGDLNVGPRAFDEHLRWAIDRFGLWPLFRDDGPGQHHHAIRPTGYDYHADKVDAVGMERWRADYRGMAPERQMLAASIIWLYRGGKDKRWLRRVPCTWHAADAVAEMHRRGVLGAWGTLVALYPGW